MFGGAVRPARRAAAEPERNIGERSSIDAGLLRQIVEMVERILACCEGLDEAGINWCRTPDTNSIYVLATRWECARMYWLCSVTGDQRDRDLSSSLPATVPQSFRGCGRSRMQVQGALARLGTKTWNASRPPAARQ